MRIMLVLAIALAFLTPVQAGAQTGLAAVDSGKHLDDLYAQLKREPNERAALLIAARIRDSWNQSGSATIDLLMQWADDAMKDKKFGVALDFLDQVTILAPRYAEGWNRRATVHYMMEDYAKSMADIDRTLVLEPRHFGALAGMAAIFKAYGDDELALETYRHILEIYPMMRDAQNAYVELTEELSGQDI